MIIEYRGPLVVFKETSQKKGYEIAVHTRRIVVDENGVLAISTSNPEDAEHWVEVKVHRKVDSKVARIDIRCASYEEALTASEAIVRHREKVMSPENIKPWHGGTK